MAKPFYAGPILNSPYLAPSLHHALGDVGQPLDHPAIAGRRPSKYLVPVPRGRRARVAGQRALDLDDSGSESGKYTPNALVNEIRGHLDSWRTLPNPNDWGVTPTTQRLLQHWRHHAFSGPRPFFCRSRRWRR